MMNKVGIMGGTFNPVHNGHIELALTAYKQFSLDKVLVMISPTPPHKAGDDILDIGDRVNMLKLAVKEYPNELEFSDFELKREGYIYTAETLTLLKDENPDTQYYFIMGGDSIENIEKWYHPEIVLEKATIIVAGRNEMRDKQMEEYIEYLKNKYNATIYTLVMNDIPISSSMIREKIKSNDTIKDFVPICVDDYIKEHRLY